MRYTISKVSKILGVSISTIRRFEERGFSGINRDESNQYRYYSLGDIERLSIYISMYRQEIIQGKRTVKAKDQVDFRQEAIKVEARLAECKRRIAELEAVSRCWEDHLELTRYCEILQNPNADPILVERPALLLDPIRNLEDMSNHSIYFQLLRDQNKAIYHFRLCNLWTVEDVRNRKINHMQAFCIPQSDIFKNYVSSQKSSILIPKRQYIVLYEENAGLIDDEIPGSEEKIIQIYDRINSTLKSQKKSLAGDVIALTLSLDSPIPSLLMIPYE